MKYRDRFEHQGYSLPPGPRIRVTVSDTYRPWVRPHGERGALHIVPADSAALLPVREACDQARVRFEEPEQAPPLPISHDAPAHPAPSGWSPTTWPRANGPRTSTPDTEAPAPTPTGCATRRAPTRHIPSAPTTRCRRMPSPHDTSGCDAGTTGTLRS